MTPGPARFRNWIAFTLAGLAMIFICATLHVPPADRLSPLHALLIGGGPDLENNGAEIESHLRFAAQILPADANRLVHFTDGKPRSRTVSFTNSALLSESRRALSVLLPGGGFGAETQSRAPDLGVKVNAAADRKEIKRAIGKVAAVVKRTPAPVLIYFAGHGSYNSDNEENNSFSLWKNEALGVAELAAELTRFSPTVPIALVMVQCYSGAFANVIFRQGDPARELGDHDIVGFFATARDREAAGCGSEIHEPEYQDFSSYFFGALCGVSRLGEPMTGADYDEDGTVTMHEAYCFALIHDDSTDAPTCTSEVFLRRFVTMNDPEVCETAFAMIDTAASPAQRAVLGALSRKLELSGEQRLLEAHDRLNFSNPSARPSLVKRHFDAEERLNRMRQTTLADLFERSPALRWREAVDFGQAAEEAGRHLDEQPSLCRELLDAQTTYEQVTALLENEEGFLLRFVRLCASIVRANRLCDSDDEQLRARFSRLWQAEARSLPLTMKPRE